MRPSTITFLGGIAAHHAIGGYADPTVAATISERNNDTECDERCRRELVFNAAHSSAAQGMTMGMLAFNSGTWCSQTDWCQSTIDSTLSQIAANAVDKSGIAGVANCDPFCLYKSMEDVSRRAKLTGLVWARDNINGTNEETGLLQDGHNQTVISGLDSMISAFSQPTQLVARATFEEAYNDSSSPDIAVREEKKKKALAAGLGAGIPSGLIAAGVGYLMYDINRAAASGSLHPAKWYYYRLLRSAREFTRSYFPGRGSLAECGDALCVDPESLWDLLSLDGSETTSVSSVAPTAADDLLTSQNSAANTLDLAEGEWYRADNYDAMTGRLVHEAVKFDAAPALSSNGVVQNIGSFNRLTMDGSKAWNTLRLPPSQVEAMAAKLWNGAQFLLDDSGLLAMDALGRPYASAIAADGQRILQTVEPVMSGAMDGADLFAVVDSTTGAMTGHRIRVNQKKSNVENVDIGDSPAKPTVVRSTAELPTKAPESTPELATQTAKEESISAPYGENTRTVTPEKTTPGSTVITSTSSTSARSTSKYRTPMPMSPSRPITLTTLTSSATATRYVGPTAPGSCAAVPTPEHWEATIDQRNGCPVPTPKQCLLENQGKKGLKSKVAAKCYRIFYERHCNDARKNGASDAYMRKLFKNPNLVCK